MKFPRRTFLALFLVLLTGWQLQAKESPKSLLSRLPARLADCQQGELKDYGDPRLGYSIAYMAEGLTITAYAYDLGRETIADGLADPAVKNAYESAKSDIKAAVEKGIYSDARLISESGAKPQKQEATLQAKYELTRQQGADAGVKVFSEIHVFGAWNHIFKLRITGKLDARDQLAPIVDKFVAEFLKAVELLPPARP